MGQDYPLAVLTRQWIGSLIDLNVVRLNKPRYNAFYDSREAGTGVWDGVKHGPIVNQKETFMSRQPTSEEIAAAHALGNAILQFLIAHKNGERAERESEDRRERAKRETEDRRIAPTEAEPKPSQDRRLLPARKAAEIISVSEFLCFLLGCFQLGLSIFLLLDALQILILFLLSSAKALARACSISSSTAFSFVGSFFRIRLRR